MSGSHGSLPRADCQRAVCPICDPTIPPEIRAIVAAEARKRVAIRAEAKRVLARHGLCRWAMMAGLCLAVLCFRLYVKDSLMPIALLSVTLAGVLWLGASMQWE